MVPNEVKVFSQLFCFSTVDSSGCFHQHPACTTPDNDVVDEIAVLTARCPVMSKEVESVVCRCPHEVDHCCCMC